MLFPIKEDSIQSLYSRALQSLKYTPELQMIECGERVSTALAMMEAGRFSQLPLVDHNGKLEGIVSERSILRYLAPFIEHGQTIPPDLKVEDCRHSPVTELVVTPEDTLFDAFAILKGPANAAIIVNSRTELKPIGIITDDDLARYLEKIAHDYRRIQTIEFTLRWYIVRAFPKKSDRRQVLRKVGGKKKIAELTMGQLFKVLEQKNFKSSYGRLLRPESSFSRFFTPEKSVEIYALRNRLAHFRDLPLTPVESDTLQAAVDHLANSNWPHSVPTEKEEALVLGIPKEQIDGNA